ncbi:hypothetical protein CK203_044531 [Vitis vinifera]|uniref:Uncharacterized protein n=1 Tax=Vitis vinifera TaxID=29760 RepID=A0A438HB90_VITVI|nr:hypothetical protein CK203_044531 [Vitis vinifera]
MPQLSSIPEQLISCLSMLQVIDMFNCGISDGAVLKDSVLSDDNEALVEELESLKYLHNLGATIIHASAFKRLLSSDKLRSCISSLCLQNFNSSSSLNLTSLSNVKCLCSLYISKCGSLEDLEIDWAGEGKETVESNYLNSKVSSHNSYHSLMCDQMQEVIGISKCAESAGNGENLSPFAKLQLSTSTEADTQRQQCQGTSNCHQRTQEVVEGSRVGG